MNEKIKNKIIIVLAIGFIISTGLCIYFGISDPSRTGEQLTLTIEQQRNEIENQRRTIEGLQDDLSGVRESVESANERAGDLERTIRAAADITERSTERIDRATGGTGTAIERQQRINSLVTDLITDNKRLKELLGSSTR